MLIGMIGVIGLVLGFGVWGSTASISGAVVAPGRVEVEAKRQVIQHPDGGVVGEILVKDGDLVEAGDVLLRLDDKLLRSELNIIEGQLFELLARGARLRAERDGKTEITFDKELTDLAATRPDVQDYIDGQKRLFAARRETRERETAQLRERQVQIEKQVEGIIAQQKAMTSQLELIDKELVDQQSLLDKQLAQASRVLALQREKARLQGQVGELTAQEAQARGRIAEIEIQILKIGTDMREEAITTLRDLEFREVELRQRRLSTLEKLSRLEIRSPVKGKIYGNTVFAIRSVVRPAEPIMYIVPVESQLVISTRVEPIHIDEVHVGQEAVLRFSAFNSRYTPEIKGKVVQVSADAFVDEARGYSYYTAEVEPEPGEMEKLADRELLPGMPVEAFIQTGERSALNYIIRPMMDYFNKAMREE
ncbi:MAG: HlyD family type I secretion periplasmic adaptor subunit [Alphaproteobacteria bacterium]|nr:MAG: HlyD family type I secretion periplasmic adaptor subunit [Alphaproteobacteria bacterium]